MDTKEKSVQQESKPAPAPQKEAPKKSSNKALWWILGGCLGLIILFGLVLVGITYWSYKKVKNEIKKNQPKIEEWQNQMEKIQDQTEQLKNQAESAVEEQPTTISEEGMVSEDSSSIYPPAVTEKAMGYIKKVYAKNGKNYLDVDYIQWLSGDAAEKAMREDGQCPKTGECIVYDDYYIRNQNPLIRTFEIAPDAQITMQTYDIEKTGQIQAQKLSLNQFSQIWNGKNARLGLKNVPYIVGIGNNQIIEIKEQYIP